MVVVWSVVFVEDKVDVFTDFERVVLRCQHVALWEGWCGLDMCVWF